MPRDRLGYIYVLAGALGFGTLPVLMKFSYDLGVAPLQVQSLRYLIATVAAWGVVGVVARHELRRFSVRFVVYLVLQSVLMIAADAMYALALDRMEASVVAVLIYMYPVFIAILVYFILRERFGGMRVGALGMTMAGCALVVGIDPTKSMQIDGPGVFMVVTAALLMAVATILLQKLTEEKSIILVVTLAFTVSTLVFGVMAPPTDVLALETAGGILAAMAVLGLFSTLFPVAMFMAGLKLIGASNAAIVAATELIVALGAAYVFLGERMAMLQFIGALMIMGAVVLLQRQPAEQRVAQSRRKEEMSNG